ncbi:MAG: hypothetical protein M1461_11195 [Nitrospirae bacterium]|nr:hypothetical protein [Nitrospirota bacterium]
MKNILLVCSLVLAVLCMGVSGAHAANPVKIDVLYMNHGPLMDTLNKMKGVFSTYGDKLTVSWHDFDSKEGEQFMASKGIKQHVPLVIWIDGKPTVTVGVKQITFTGFPTGSGPAFFQGKWTIDDLKGALNLATAKK